jgi:hypothetical protein
MNTSSNHAPTRACVAPGFCGRIFSSAGKLDAAEEAAIITVAVLLLPSVPTEQVTPASALDTLQEKATVLPKKPLIGVKVSVDVALPPGVTVKVPGETLSEKSAGTVVKLKTLDQAPYTPLEDDNTLTCQ